RDAMAGKERLGLVLVESHPDRERRVEVTRTLAKGQGVVTAARTLLTQAHTTEAQGSGVGFRSLRRLAWRTFVWRSSWERGGSDRPPPRRACRSWPPLSLVRPGRRAGGSGPSRA